MIEPVRPGDVVRSGKSHPCGSDRWLILRTGADVKLKCEGCGRVIMLDRDTFLRRLRAVVSRSGSASGRDSCQ